MSTDTLQPGFMRMGTRIVPISRPFNSAKMKTKRFLLALQFYEGDRDAAEELASLIADLERTRNHTADILLMRRADSRELSTAVKAKLAAKFGMVHQHVCRRSDARSYPHGSNQMFFDLITLMAYPPYVDDYYAFINLETDVVPTRPGWIGELIKAWETKPADKLAIGFIHDNPVTHLNGVAIYAANFQRAVARGQLRGANPQIAYDINHSPSILPVAGETPLIHFSYRQPTVTRDELFAPRKDGIVPAVYHGVKDGTARALVRARHITFTDIAPVVIQPKPPTPVEVLEWDETSARGTTASEVVENAVASNIDSIKEPLDQALGVSDDIGLPDPVPASPTKRENVYTYFQQGPGRQSAEITAILDLWRKGWASRGWNPIVLTLRDAAKHARFDELAEAMEKLPYVGDRKKQAASFNRWLAMDSTDGGLMVDLDVLPGAFTPADVIRWDTGLVLSPRDGGEITAAVFDKTNLAKFIAALESYDAKPEDVLGKRAHVSGMTVWLSHASDAVEPTVVNSQTESEAPVKLRRFASEVRKVEAMRLFLEGVPA